MTKEVRATVVRESACELEGGTGTPHGELLWRTLVSGDRTPTEALTVGVADVAPGSAGSTRPHRHAQAEVYYTLSGRGVVRVDGVEHALSPGTTVFIPGHATHHAWNTGVETLRILYVFACDSIDQIAYEYPEG